MLLAAEPLQHQIQPESTSKLHQGREFISSILFVCGPLWTAGVLWTANIMNFSRATSWQSNLLSVQHTDHSGETETPSVLMAATVFPTTDVTKRLFCFVFIFCLFLAELCPKAKYEMVFITSYQHQNTHTHTHIKWTPVPLGIIVSDCPQSWSKEICIFLNVSAELCNYVKPWVCVIDCSCNCLCMGRGGMFSAAMKGEVLAECNPSSICLTQLWQFIKDTLTHYHKHTHTHTYTHMELNVRRPPGMIPSSCFCDTGDDN